MRSRSLARFAPRSPRALAWDDSKYPDFSGQWRPIGGPGRWARDQKAPLTPEYQAIFEADAAEGGQSFHNKTYLCWSPGMPRVTNGCGKMNSSLQPRRLALW